MTMIILLLYIQVWQYCLLYHYMLIPERDETTNNDCYIYTNMSE